MTPHRKLRPSLALIGASALLFVTAGPAAAPPGDLDPTFDTDGRVTTDFAGDFDAAHGVAIQDDGKIVAAGSVGGDFGLGRYNTDGSLDPSFDSDGKVTTDFVGGFEDAYGVAIQGDGKIVAAGSVGGDFGLARYNTDGTLDSAFGGDGKVTTDLGGSPDRAYGVAIQGDGKIVAAGSAGLPGTSLDFALARYNTDGSLDPTFDSDGKVTSDFASGPDQAYGLAIQDDGKIVAAGCSACFQVTGPGFSLARYNADGSLDTTFDGDGKVTTDFGTHGGAAHGVAIQDQKIVAAGLAFFVSTRVFALGRYNADGSLDTTFNQDGKVTTDLATSDGANGVAIQPDGRIVAAGQARDPDVNVDFAVARYRGDLEADLSLTKTGPSGRVPTGRNMTYTVAVTNTGPDEASDVVVTDTLPASVTFVGATSDLPVGFCDPPSGGVLICHLGSIGSGVERRIYITVKPTQAGMITNSASVTSPTPDYNLANNSDSVDTAICRITSRRSSIPCG